MGTEPPGGGIRRVVLIAVDGSLASPNLVAWAMRFALKQDDKGIIANSKEETPEVRNPAARPL